MFLKLKKAQLFIALQVALGVLEHFSYFVYHELMELCSDLQIPCKHHCGF